MGQFSGTNLPKNIKSTGNQLFVKFHSDHSNQYKGFSASLTNGKNFFIIRSNLFLNKIACNHNFVMTKDRKREQKRCAAVMKAQSSRKRYLEPNLYYEFSIQGCLGQSGLQREKKIYSNSIDPFKMYVTTLLLKTVKSESNVVHYNHNHCK